jgi:outer membrane protein assembly factor BamB
MPSLVVVPGLGIGVSRTQVIGMDPSSGQVLWTVARATGPLSTAAVDPTAGSHGVAVFTEGDAPGKSALVGLDLSTHARLWSLPLSDLARGSPTVEGGRAYVGTRDAYVYAADTTDGSLVWKSRAAGSVDSTPAVAEGRVFVVSQDTTTGEVRLAALDTSTGRSRWSYLQPGAALGPSSATVASGVVYVGFGDLVVRAFEAGTGKVLWTQLGRGSFSYLTTPAAVGQSVYVLDRVGGVYRLEATTGKRVWDYQFPADVTWSSPIVADGFVYVGMDDGTVAAIDDRKGRLVWQTRLAGPIGALAPAGDLLLAPIVTGAGGLVGFGHDPNGVLLDVPSPTEVDIPVALANFAGAFMIMTALLLGLFRYVLRPRRQPVPVAEAGGIEAEVEGP